MGKWFFKVLLKPKFKMASLDELPKFLSAQNLKNWNKK